MEDRLTVLLQRFELRARTYHNGELCGSIHFDGLDGVAHLHLLRVGTLTIIGPDGSRRELSEPTALFYPRPLRHGLCTAPGQSVDLVCAAIEFGQAENPVLRSLPDVLVIPLAGMQAFEVTQALLFNEAMTKRCGHPIVVDRLTEVLMVQLLRYAIEKNLAHAGLMAGLADRRLAKALNAMHADPAKAWTLETLADTASMSRARFAARFKQVLGMTSGEYLVQWRVSIAKGLLRRGLPVKDVAVQVGYGDSRSFGRAFSQAVGATPTEWVKSRAHA
jgi:AraC-like DNA-binding protein